MLRRKLAGFLAAVMLITSVPANVWAEEVLPETEEIQLLSEAEENVSEQAAAPEINAETEAPEEVEPETEAPAETEAVTEPETKAPAETEAVAQPETEAPTETEAVTEPETKAPVETEAVTEPETEAPAETEGMTEPITETPDKTEPATETITEALAEAEKETEVQTEAVIEESEQAADKTAEELSDVVCEKPDIKGEFRTGEEIVCTPKVSGGSGTYAYNYWLFDSTGTIVLSKENTFEDSWTFIAPEEGIYLLRVYATDFHSDSHSDTDWFAIEKAAEANAVQVSGVEVQGQMETGSRLTATATVKGGSGTYAYNYWLFDSTGTIVLSKENTFDTSWTFEAPKGGTYLMRIYATDFATESYADSSWFAIEGNEVQVTDVKVEGEYKAGARLTVTPTVEGGSGSYAYNYWLFDSNGTIVLSHENTMDTSWSFVVPDGGTYLMRVYATDFATEHYADSSWFAVEFNNVKVGSVEVEDGIPGGETMRVTAQVSGGSGSYAYNYWVFDSTGNIVLRKENTFDAYADFVMPKEGGVYLVRVYATDFRTDDHSDSSWFYVVPSAENELAAPEIEEAFVYAESTTVYISWYGVKNADRYEIYEQIDGREELLQTTTLTSCYTDASVGNHTYLVRAAMHKEDGSWVYSPFASATLRVYNYSDPDRDVLYLRKGKTSAGDTAEWFSVLSFVIGTTSSWDEINGPVAPAYRIDFLRNGEVVASAQETVQMVFFEEETAFNWSEGEVWQKAYEEGATEVRISLLENPDPEYYFYEISETESAFTLSLNEKQEAVTSDIICSWPEVAELDRVEKITFTSRQPENLTADNGRVAVYRAGELFGEAVLTSDNPTAEFEFSITETGKGIPFTFTYIYGSYEVTECAEIWANRLQGFDIYKQKIALGDTETIYGIFDDNQRPLKLEWSSSDESVIRIVSAEIDRAEFEAVGVGKTVITAKTSSGNTLSQAIWVYDPDNTELPALYLMPPQPGDKVTDYGIPVRVATTTDQSNIANDWADEVRFRVRFLDENGNCVSEEQIYQGISLVPEEDGALGITELPADTLENYYRGATKAEVTLLPLSGVEYVEYTVAAENQPVVLSLEGIDEILDNAEIPYFTLLMPEYAHLGDMVQMGIVCLNPEALTEPYPVTLWHEDIRLYNGLMTAEDPEIMISMPITGSYTWEFTAETTAWADYGYIKILGGEMEDRLLEVGSSTWLWPNFWYVDAEEPTRYESSNPSVVSVDSDGMITGMSPGLATLTASQGTVVITCTVRVYSAESATEIPEMYIASDESESASWFEALDYRIGTNTDLSKVGEGQNINVEISFLKDQQPLSIARTETIYFPSLHSEEIVSWDPDDAGIWYEAFSAGATHIRIELLESEYGEYTVDGERKSVTFALPDSTSVDRPVIEIDCPETVEKNEEGLYPVTVTCLNPEKLDSRYREVTFSLYDTGDTQTYTLSEENPSVTYQAYCTETAFDLGIDYPGENGYDWTSFYVSATELQSLGENIRIPVGGVSWIYPEFSNGSLELTWESSDETVAVIYEVNESDWIEAEVRGESAGIATITARTPGGTEKSVDVVVFGPEQTEPPALYLKPAADGETADWNMGVPVCVSTTSDMSTVPEIVSAQLRLEFLDEAGEVKTVFETSEALSYGAKPDYPMDLYIIDTMARAYIDGARRIRITLLEDAYGEYTLADGMPLTSEVKMTEPKDLEEPVIASLGPETAEPGGQVSIGICCLNPSALEGEIRYVEIYHNEELLAEGELTAQNDRVTADVITPDTGEMYYSYEVRVDGNTEIYENIRLLGGDFPGIMVGIGEMAMASPNFWFWTGDPVVYSISDPKVASVDEEGIVTGLSEGVATLTADNGETVLETQVRIYDPEKEYDTLPEMYLEQDSGEIAWFENVPFGMGNTVDFTTLGGSGYINVGIEATFFKDGEPLDIGPCTSGYHFDLPREYIDPTWYDEAAWAQAFQQEADQLQLRLLAPGEYDTPYEIDENRQKLIYNLPPVSECTYPVIISDLVSISNNTLEVGQNVEVTFTCLNPQYLTDETNQVKMAVYGIEKTGVLSEETPAVTLSVPYQSGEDGTELWVSYINAMGNKQEYSFWVYFTELLSIGKDTKLEIGSQLQLYPEYFNNMGGLELSFESSDVSVATVETDEYGTPIVTGRQAGTAVITATTPAGNQKSVRIMVYDSAATESPEIYLTEIQSSAFAGWDGTTFEVATTTDPSKTAGNIYITIMTEYLDGSGTVVYTPSVMTGCSINFFENVCQASIAGVLPDMATAYYKGAEQVRISLIEGWGYSLAENANLSITLSLQDIAESEEPEYALIYPQRACAGETVELSVICINPARLSQEYALEFYHYSSDGTRQELLGSGSITGENPEVTVSAVMPQEYEYGSYSYYYFRVHRTDQDGWTDEYWKGESIYLSDEV